MQAQELKRQQEQARRLAKQKKTMNMLLTAIKAQLFDGKLEDQSISPKLLEVTVAAAKQAVKERSLFSMIYSPFTQKDLNAEKTVTRKELDLLLRQFVPKITEFELAEVATFLYPQKSQEEEPSSKQDRLLLQALDQLLEKFL